MSLTGAAITGRWSCAGLTGTAGTRIQVVIPPFRQGKTVVTGFKYSPTTTAQTLNIFMAVGSTFLAKTTPTATTLTVVANPALRNIAANDFLVVEGEDTTLSGGRRVFDLIKVSGTPVINSDGTVTITQTAAGAGGWVALSPTTRTWQLENVTSTNPNFSTAGAKLLSQDRMGKGNKVWLMALTTDTVPGYGLASPSFLTPTTALELPGTSQFPAGIAASQNDYEPLLFDCANATNAGILTYLAAIGLNTGPGKGSGN